MKGFSVLGGMVGWVGRRLVWVVSIGVIVLLGYYLTRPAPPSSEPVGRGASMASAPAAPVGTIWTCAMHPQIRQNKPGRCPICGMTLVPVAMAHEGASPRTLVVSEDAKALMEIETSPVERRFVEAQIRMVGKVQYDETKLGYITAWFPGRLDRLFVDFTGIVVRKGDHMVAIYSPALLTAQTELLQAIQAEKELQSSQMPVMRKGAASTVQAGRDKLRLWGLTAEQVAEIEHRGAPVDTMTIYAPMSGIVIAKEVQQGSYEEEGTRIYTIADLSEVWVKLDAYESDLMWLRYGQNVEFTTVSYPGETFTGIISFIDPVLDSETRTVKVRVNAPNGEGKLKPGMFVKSIARAQVAAGGRVMDPRLAGKWICPMHPSVIKDSPGKCDICQMPLVTAESLGYVGVEPTAADKPLVIPVSAPLVTGTRAVVYVEVPGTAKPTYEGREIVLGPRAGDYYLVRSGLKEGQRVVTRGNFKIDSSLQIQAKPSMMSPEGGGGGMEHQHGGGPAMGESSAGGAVAISPKAGVQLHAVLSAADEVNKALAGEDLAPAKGAFAALEKAVEAVDMKLLEGHAHMLWMESAMRLTNDAVEGKEAQTLGEARRVGQSLAKDAALLREQFGLAHGGHTTSPAAGDSNIHRHEKSGGHAHE